MDTFLSGLVVGATVVVGLASVISILLAMIDTETEKNEDFFDE